jgi:hypothetical protein
MPNIRAVPSIYPTIAAAQAAAAAGDTILIDPGTWDNVLLTKPVHLLGNTTNPVGNPVIIRGSGNYADAGNDGVNTKYAIHYSLSATPGFPIHVQNIKSQPGSGSWSGHVVWWAPAGATLYLNRCILPSNGQYWYPLQCSNGTTISLFNCTVGTGYNYCLVVYGNPAQTFNLIKTRLEAVPSTYAGTEPLTIPIKDYILVDTINYGANYGDTIIDDYPWGKVFGQVIFPAGVDRSQTKVRIHRLISGQMELTPFAVTTPNSVTGQWIFNYLPIDTTYWVARINPVGYRSFLDGPYTLIRVV